MTVKDFDPKTADHRELFIAARNKHLGARKEIVVRALKGDRTARESLKHLVKPKK